MDADGQPELRPGRRSRGHALRRQGPDRRDRRRRPRRGRAGGMDHRGDLRPRLRDVRAGGLPARARPEPPPRSRGRPARQLPGPRPPGQLVALPDGGALLVGRNHWAKHHADVLQSIRFDPARRTWQETGSPCAGVGYNDSAGMHRTPPPCLIGGFVAGLDGGRVLSAGRGPSSELPSEPKAAAIYDPAADAWLEQPSLPDEYAPGIAVGLTDGTALVVGGRQDRDTADTLRFIPPR